ncbi:NADH-quinone oxidoreductase subunit J [Sandaracinus amylolyticus]|uniref:NADH-quinone oxidoreductase subunit J n=1 Tax=Sandaracinus amylolyticus TaxID=927083 RepID=A0A0F6W379_9BACT|nr:NADH-quinone oxidoreductase subunit J [Sandaracinus amylolyticus]AKF06127.1 NADH-ubiquinone oxidoreductase chain J [Sandaracinus amylolyticus]
MSTSGELLFLVCGFAATIAAVLTVTMRNPLRSAIALLVHVISLAGLYLTLHAHLLAAIQLIVYAGAIVVLFVFVIMLIGPGAMEHRADTRGWVMKTIGGGLIVLFAGAITFSVGEATAPEVAIATCDGSDPACREFGSVEALSDSIYRQAAVPFELVSMLLLVAIIAAIGTARGRTAAQKDEADPVEARRMALRPFANDAEAPSLNPAKISTVGQGPPHPLEIGNESDGETPAE